MNYSWFTHPRGVTMVRGRIDYNRSMDVVQINGKKARDCTPRECEVIGEFYYKLTELQTIAEKLRCPRPLDLRRLVTLASRLEKKKKEIKKNPPFLIKSLPHNTECTNLSGQTNNSPSEKGGIS